MLKLKRVEIQGFKSFVDRTEMRFHGHGVAAIVGPNGCGKSNLADAINWVLGEQSAKSLRGSRMEDVIFAGTRDRKPLGMASVTMTLIDPGFHEEKAAVPDAPPEVVVVEEPIAHTNGNGTNGHNGNGHNGHGHNGNGHNGNGHHTPPEFAASALIGKAKEITVTRRLYRNGDSEYLVDGKAARLRDIQDIFMGTGLGPESYAIIEQGRIGQILSTKPADRRAVIEEAAGITKFKTRRRLAEAKLESAKQNLNRVFDILEEVGRQMNSLKRQANKAQRYQELRTELVAALKVTLAGKFRILERDAAKAALDLNAASTELQQLTVEVAQQEQHETKLYEDAIATEQKLTEARQKLAELQVEAERTRGRLEGQKTQISSMEQRLTQGEGESSSLEQRLAVIQEEITSQMAIFATLTAESESVRGRLQEKTAERDQLQGQLHEQERSLESSRQLVLRMLSEAGALKNQLAQTDSHLAAMARDSERLTRDEQSAAGDLERLEGVRAEIGEKLSARQTHLQTLGEQRADVESALGERKRELAESKTRLEQVRAETSRLKARRDSLEEIISHRSYTTDSVKRLFTAVGKGEASDLAPVGVLADFVEVDQTYERAAEEFLHEELEYVVVENFTEAHKGIEVMRRDVDGRATFLVHPEPGAHLERGPVSAPQIGPDTGIVARLSDVLRMTNGLTKAPDELLPRVSRCYLADSKESAQRLSLQYPDIYFLLPDGVCYHGYAVSGGKKSSSGPLALKRELRELVEKYEAGAKELTATLGRTEQLEIEVQGLSDQLEQLKVAQQQEEKEALALGHEHRKLAEEHARASQRLSVARLELERIRTQSETATARKTELEAKLAEREQQRLEMEHSLEAARGELSGLQSRLRHAVEEHAVLRAELAGMEERHRAADAARVRFEAQLNEFRSRKQGLSSELERIGVERARLLESNIELDSKAVELMRFIEEVERTVEAHAKLEEEQRAGLDQVSESLKISRQAVAELTERRQQVEVELVRKKSDLAHLEETCQKELAMPLAELSAAVENAPDEIQQMEAEEQYLELRKRIDALGAVNPDALAEYEETQQRYEFLNTQRQDLLDSIRDTEKTIQEIDVESKKRFQEAFEAINKNFREMFGVLFNGGHGEMRLTDQENQADSGIDIVAQPPGKKLQNVLLMSGGERAMTAMALLMSVFKYQPSPFCILDEVDAPLDEPNILRLTKLIKEMADQTQFIVITHAKRTMEAAQVLYGVTMQEPGVSKLVSVKFNAPQTAPPIAMAAAASAAPAN